MDDSERRDNYEATLRDTVDLGGPSAGAALDLYTLHVAGDIPGCLPAECTAEAAQEMVVRIEPLLALHYASPARLSNRGHDTGSAFLAARAFEVSALERLVEDYRIRASVSASTRDGSGEADNKLREALGMATRGDWLGFATGSVIGAALDIRRSGGEGISRAASTLEEMSRRQQRGEEERYFGGSHEDASEEILPEEETLRGQAKACALLGIYHAAQGLREVIYRQSTDSRTPPEAARYFLNCGRALAATPFSSALSPALPLIAPLLGIGKDV